ncbi:purine-cytosine permease family protein [Marinobacterium sedimentorum]|uniref:purine-cytosine permease family protein n=1 Tax=Marinobacterium sedimentorum TaxID=2927804 RepID=UPI0020C71E2B|nr:allantoin permease [Marinobacterium sedimentorum]MCP8687177.1 allantoin permease [Marinobacterium sedimentorum]
MAGNIKSDGSNADYSAVAVPHKERMKKNSLTMAWWAICSAMFWLVVAATLAMNFGTLNAIIGLVLSVITFGVVNGIIARYAIKTGLSVALFSRVLFGHLGASLATLIFFATAIYYSVFEGSVIAVAIQSYFPSLTLNEAYLLVVFYSVPLVFGSVQNWLDKFNGVLLPFYILGLIAAVVMSIWAFGYSNDWLTMGPETGPVENGWWNCFTYFMGVWILMMYTWDYARFGHQDDADYHAKVNFGMPFYLFTFLVNGLVGIFLAATIPTEGGLSEVSVVLAIIQLMGIWGLLFVWVSQTRINTANFYLAAENMQAFFERFGLVRVPRFAWAMAVGAVVYFLMRLNVFSFILQALAYQGIFVVAWVAIALAHIFSPRYDQLFDGRIEYQLDRVTALNPCGLIAWFLAAGLGILLLNYGNAELALFASPVTFVVAFCSYWLLLNSARQHWFVKAEA